MNNRGHSEDHEEEVGDNHHNDGDPIYEESVATL